MKILEYFKEQFDNRVAEGCGNGRVCTISPEIDENSYQWIKYASQWFFGGAYDYDFKSKGITQQQLNKAVEDKYLKYTYYSNWMAKKLNQTNYYSLTAKGLKVFYNTYFK